MIVLSIEESLGRVRQSEAARAAGVDEVAWQQGLEEGLRDAGLWLIENNLRQAKFTQQARNIYMFHRRSPRYEAKKRKDFVLDPETGVYVRPARPPIDLVYTGRLRDYIKDKPAEAYNMKISARGTKVRMVIPIPTPHRMQKLQYEELSRWSQREYVAMRRIIIERVAARIGLRGAGDARNIERMGRYSGN